jgi:hypothetical protein
MSLTKHPTYQSASPGRVLKVPTFPEAYTGPKRLDLDVIGARAGINAQKEYVFTGEVLGPIDPAKSAIYSFLINRKGASSPSQIPGRPTLTYDSVVTVTTGSGKTTGTISLLDSQGQATAATSLSSTEVRVNGNAVNVMVPASSLPTKATRNVRMPRMITSFTFQAAVPGGRPSDIAGSVSEFMSM